MLRNLPSRDSERSVKTEPLENRQMAALARRSLTRARMSSRRASRNGSLNLVGGEQERHVGRDGLEVGDDLLDQGIGHARALAVEVRVGAEAASGIAHGQGLQVDMARVAHMDRAAQLAHHLDLLVGELLNPFERH